MGMVPLSRLRLGVHLREEEIPLADGTFLFPSLNSYTHPVTDQIFYFANRYLLFFAMIGM
jgi:hypothetical protein